MKERIYTIPLTESIEQMSECPFCYLENKIENEEIEYALGPAMMEPDHRILSNQLGYCRRHTKKLTEGRQALPLALVMDTRIDEVIGSIEKALEKGRNAKKGGIFSKKEQNNFVKEEIKKLTSSCLVCEKIEHTMKNFIKTFWYLYEKEPDFKEKILKSKGFCLNHFNDLVNSGEGISGRKRETFIEEITDLELLNLKRNKKDVSAFVKQFDYRSDKENNDIPKDAHLTCARKLSKF